VVPRRSQVSLQDQGGPGNTSRSISKLVYTNWPPGPFPAIFSGMLKIIVCNSILCITGNMFFPSLCVRV
jgi:hypothetical protein